MFTVATAAAAAADILAAAETESYVFHNVALCSEVIWTLTQSKRPANKALGEQVRVAMEAYFTARG